MASILISPNPAPSGHPGIYKLTLFGTGTTWTGSTTFTLSGVANITKISQQVFSGISAILVITTGAGTGTLTVSDGTNSGTTVISLGAQLNYTKNWFPGLRRKT